MPHKCHACHAMVLDKPKEGTYTCMTTKLATGCELPASCWQTQYPHLDSGRVFAQAIPARRRKDKLVSQQLDTFRDIAKDLAEHIQSGTLDDTAWQAIYDRYGRYHPAKLFARIQHADFVALGLHGFQEVLNYAELKDPLTHRASPNPEWSQEIQQGFSAWIAHTYTMANTRRKRGQRFSTMTVVRRASDARFFCDYIHAKGVQRWQQVAQRHLDELVCDHGVGRGQHVYAFLKFIKEHYHFTHRFIRPKRSKPNPMEMILTDAEMAGVRRRIQSQTSPDVALVLCLVAYYGQTATGVRHMKYGQFRKTEGGRYSALLNKIWVPLDPITQSFLEALMAERSLAPDDLSALAEVPFLLGKGASERTFRDHVSLQAGKDIDLRRLRHTAIRNLLRHTELSRGEIADVCRVSMPTLRDMERTLSWDRNSYVSEEAAKVRHALLHGET